MMKLVLVLTSLMLIASDFALANKEEVIRSKEDIIFHTPDMFKFSDVGKISEFRGVIDRVYFTSSDLKMVDLYQFKTDEVKVNQDLCMAFVEKIFSLKTSRLYSLKSLKIESSNKGNICEAHIADRNKVKEDPYIRFVTVGFINAKANVLVYHPKSIQDDKITEIRKFWNSLR
jgi:hypothetical protein